VSKTKNMGWLFGLVGAVLGLLLWLGLPAAAKSCLTYAERPLVWRNWGAGPGYLIVWVMFTPAATILAGILGVRLARWLDSRPQAPRRQTARPQKKRSFGLSGREWATITAQVVGVLIPGLMAVSSYNQGAAEEERRAAEAPAREALRQAELQAEARAELARHYPELARGQVPAQNSPGLSAAELLSLLESAEAK
jgi:hypothetical protein